MAKKKITSGMLGGRKKKSLDEIEKAVAQIHEPQVEKPKPIPEQKETPKPPIQEVEKSNPIPKPKREVAKPVRFSFNLTKDLHRRFKMLCLEKDTTMQDEILKMIQKSVFKK
jgi:outer membrane biosynthesis protein TonB